MSDLEFQLTSSPLSPEPLGWDARFGAEVSFVGVVRGLEDGEEIAGIEYSAYPEMVGNTFETLATTAQERFPEHRVRIVHRTGFVAAAEPSVSLQVSSAHSPSALEICGWYLAELKLTVPIWKRIVPAS